MKIFFVMFIAFLLSSCVSTGLGIINGIAKTSKFTIRKDISYGPHKHNKLDLYLPKAEKISTTVVFFYGGCWGQCSELDKHHYLFIAESLTEQGFAVVIPDYRKYPEVKFDEIMDDAKNAVLWTIENSDNYAPENKNIYLMGHSAGAHMAAMLVANKSYLDKSLSFINGFIGLAGPYNFLPFSDDYMYQLFSAENDFLTSQPINFIDGSEPPFLIIHGKNDKKVNPKNATSFSAKLSEFKVKNELVLLDKKSHTAVLLNLAKPFRNDTVIFTAITNFINKYKNSE